MEQQKSKKGKPIKAEKVFSKGSVSVQVFRRQAPSGYRYPTIKLSRTWKAQGSGKDMNSDEFFADNEEELVAAIRAACAFARGDTVEPSQPAN